MSQPVSILPAQAFWAKLSPDRWHPLSAHLADVAAVVERLLRPGHTLAARLARALGHEALPREVRQSAIFLAFLHDVGKVQHGFQRRRDPTIATPPNWRGHVRPLLNSSANVPALRDRLRAVSIEVGGTTPLFTAICHHGVPYMAESVASGAAGYWHADGDRDPLAEFDRVMGWARAFADMEHATPPRWTELGLHLLAGIITLADWVGSSEQFFPLTPHAAADPADYWSEARRRATHACAQVGLAPRRVQFAPATDALTQLFPRTFPRYRPSVLQRHLADMPLPEPGTRVLIESDTGSGKTEAALTLFARLRAAGRVDALFFALPTRATANAMVGRVEQMVAQLYPADDRPGVEIAVGGQTSARATAAADASQYPDDPEPALIQRWTSQSTRHAMAAEIIVGTVDQALLAGLAARHAHLRVAGLTRALLVVDEVHAYDRYMTTVLRHLTDFHTSVGGIALFMSATLATEARAALSSPSVRHADTLPLTNAIARPYPSLSQLAPGGRAWAEVHLPAEGVRDRTVAWTIATEAGAIAQAIAAARHGARVLVLRNTVRDARNTLALVSGAAGADLLWRPPGASEGVAYHARYTRADRAHLDAVVVGDFGPGSSVSGVILVATQVAEQSLDLDFDLLISDLAPVDVLLQRVGRVHRHQRADRHGIATPTAVVIGPLDPLTDLVQQQRRTSAYGHGTVYSDFGDLELTQRLIAARPHVRLPEECRLLVESVYHANNRAALSDESAGWTRHLQGRDGDALGADTHAEVCVVRFDQAYVGRVNVERFGGLSLNGGAREAKVRTRLGDDRIRLELPQPVANAFAPNGPTDAFVDLDARVLGRAGISGNQVNALKADGMAQGDGCTVLQLGPLRLTYDAMGWQWSTSDHSR